METSENDKLLRDFFGEHKSEIADFGFSQRVMRKLPDERNYGWIVWLFALLGWGITLLLGIYTGVFYSAFLWFRNMPQIYIPIAVFSFSVVLAIVVVVNQGKTCKLLNYC